VCVQSSGQATRRKFHAPKNWGNCGCPSGLGYLLPNRIFERIYSFSTAIDIIDVVKIEYFKFHSMILADRSEARNSAT
jgi:hypothetical protein